MIYSVLRCVIYMDSLAKTHAKKVIVVRLFEGIASVYLFSSDFEPIFLTAVYGVSFEDPVLGPLLSGAE